jgi:hypothetical protein
MFALVLGAIEITATTSDGSKPAGDAIGNDDITCMELGCPKPTPVKPLPVNSSR